MNRFKTNTCGVLIATSALCAMAMRLAVHARADSAEPEIVNRFTATDGQKLFSSICQGCHMPDARGAKGAGMYPALAGNPKLVSATYPQYVVLNGLRGMPEFGHDLDDAQVAAVVNYVVTHFGNHAKTLATPATVAALRPTATSPF